MTRHRKQRQLAATPPYILLVQPLAYRELKQLPGYVRQRVQRAIGSLRNEPRPPDSQELTQDVTSREARRLRLDEWRILYAIDDVWREIAVVAIRKRPPYQYEDLEKLLTGLEDD